MSAKEALKAGLPMVKEDVWGFDIPMYDLELVFQVVEGTHHRWSDLTDNGLRDGLGLQPVDELVELVQRDVHDLHADPTVALLE